MHFSFHGHEDFLLLSQQSCKICIDNSKSSHSGSVFLDEPVFTVRLVANVNVLLQLV